MEISYKRTKSLRTTYKVERMPMRVAKTIPVIDLFAGPGGLGEGFAALHRKEGKKYFQIDLSVEKDPAAHATLLLRSFFRQFEYEDVPLEYYAFLRGEISRDALFKLYPRQGACAEREAWCAELGSGDKFNRQLDEKIERIIGSSKKWVLIGGPPCQAYSVVGRSRNRGINGYKPEKDKRHFLYREYLRIIAKHRPPVYVMENVKGILSSKVYETLIFDKIIEDLRNPASSSSNNRGYTDRRSFHYEIFSLVNGRATYDLFGKLLKPRNFIIKSEKYGVPQSRHRVVLLGVRSDILAGISPLTLDEEEEIPVSHVIQGLPMLRSGLSLKEQESDSRETWRECITSILRQNWLSDVSQIAGREVYDHIINTISNMKLPQQDKGGEFIAYNASIGCKHDWYLDDRIGGVCNHTARNHLIKDLHRYLYAACFSQVNGYSPTLVEYPKDLLPNHNNLSPRYFNDRFRVQLADRPATTVTSHVSKDGHYYIHPDPSQCRSLTVREAARLQTFPDNYYFMGNRTQQYVQVGNAVPPVLAIKIAEIVRDILDRM